MRIQLFSWRRMYAWMRYIHFVIFMQNPNFFKLSYFVPLCVEKIILLLRLKKLLKPIENVKYTLKLKITPFPQLWRSFHFGDTRLHL